MINRVFFVILFFIVPLVSFAQIDNNGTLFLNARNAAQKGNWTLFNDIKAQLSNYPLLPYLDYYQLEKNLSTADNNTIQEFLIKYANTPLAARIRSKWLMQLAKQQNWSQFLTEYRSDLSATVQCNYLNALMQTGKIHEADGLTAQLWQSNTSQPTDCDMVFMRWLNAQNDRDNLLWSRFELALTSRNINLANYLALEMSATNKHTALAIIKLYGEPNLVNSSAFQNKYPSPQILSFGIARLAQRDPLVAIKTWNQLSTKYQFNQEQKQRIFQAIALKLALRKNSQSLVWFEKIKHSNLDPVYDDWLICAALYQQDWTLVRNRIEQMPREEKEIPKWQYWYARALQQLGYKYEAKAIFETIANQRTFYGFLAQNILHRPIEIKNNIPSISTNEVDDVKRLDSFQRAALLHQLNLDYDAWLELSYIMPKLTKEQQYVITKLVSEWQWYPETLLLSNKIAYKDDVTIRFPMLYENVVIENAKLRNINPALIYAIMRQESYFGVDSISPAGAIGLMQLMPTTAIRTSRQYKMKYSDVKELLNADLNIAFGSAHLRKALMGFSNNPVLAIAAYNAGPEAVNRWLPKNTNVPADIWIETIPFHETRNYVKNVITNFIVYQYRLGQRPDINSIMPQIKSKQS